MKPNVTRVEVLASMVEMIEAHRDHDAARRGVTFVAEGGETERANEVLAESCDRPVVFADSGRRRVQVELGYFKPDGAGSVSSRKRQVIVWNAADGVPAEVEVLRELQGDRVMSHAWAEGLRAAMPAEAHENLVEQIKAAESLVGCSVVKGVAQLAWSGDAPKLDPIEWTLQHDDGFGEIKLTMNPHIAIDPRGVALISWFVLDVDDAHESPIEFRKYVEGFAWKEAGARLVFGEPSEVTGLARSEQAIEPVLIESASGQYGRPSRTMTAGEVTFEIPVGPGNWGPVEAVANAFGVPPRMIGSSIKRLTS